MRNPFQAMSRSLLNPDPLDGFLDDPGFGLIGRGFQPREQVVEPRVVLIGAGRRRDEAGEQRQSYREVSHHASKYDGAGAVTPSLPA